MGEKSIVSTIIQSFPKGTREIWRQAASAEINGGEPFETLSWNNSDGLRFSPYYDCEDIAGIISSKSFSLPAAKVPFAGARRWLYASYVPVEDALTSNKISLEHLRSGADAIFYSLMPSTSVDFKNLLAQIEWDYCSLYFSLQEDHGVALRKYITDSKLNIHKLTGALFWDTLPKKAVYDFFLNDTNLKSFGLVVTPSTPVKEVASALVQTVRLIESSGENVKTVFANLACSMTANADFFGTICKLRALRGLLYQLAHVYGIDEYAVADVHIHVISEPWVKEGYQPHGNLIKSTTAAMAAIVGGCDSLTVRSEINSNNTMTRIARNVSSILREESHFDKVADSVEGAYAFEVMTDRIAKEAWTLFQTEMK